MPRPGPRSDAGDAIAAQFPGIKSRQARRHAVGHFRAAHCDSIGVELLHFKPVVGAIAAARFTLPVIKGPKASTLLARRALICFAFVQRGRNLDRLGWGRGRRFFYHRRPMTDRVFVIPMTVPGPNHVAFDSVAVHCSCVYRGLAVGGTVG
jgi:hypothetical protein